MDNENEQLARWLGWEFDPRDCLWHMAPGDDWVSTPDFRTSNEWAGAVLERLQPFAPRLNFNSYVGKWRCQTFVNPIADAIGRDWRSAVVDAALEVIRRDSSAAGEQ